MIREYVADGLKDIYGDFTQQADAIRYQLSKEGQAYLDELDLILREMQTFWDIVSQDYNS